MATIADLHKSISEMSESVLLSLIRHIRSLRREIPIKPVRETVKKKNKKQTAISEHLANIGGSKKEELLKRLLEIQKRRNR